jgi:cytochrome c biogenesis protein CcmG, thiol:disulfide interchange protein DsbE
VTPSMTTRHLAGLVAAAAMVLSGCAGSAEPTAPTFGTGRTGDSTPPQALAKLKQRAGIAACPRLPAVDGPAEGGMPDVTLGCLGGGRPVNLAALRGSPTLVNVWAQYCGPCKEESPLLQRLHEDSATPIRVIGIDFDDPLTSRAIAFAASVGVTYPQLADPDTELRTTMGVAALPVTFFVDPNGEVTGRFYGAVTSYQQLTGLVEDHLGVTP